MNKELIEKIVKFALQWNNTGTRLDFERFLTKHLSGKVVIDEEVYKAMEAECTLAAIKRGYFTIKSTKDE